MDRHGIGGAGRKRAGNAQQQRVDTPADAGIRSPVLGVVLGRSETAYWAQLREAFRLADFRMPPVVPRTEYTLLEGTVQKHMRKFGLSFEDVFFRLEEEKERWLKSQDEWDLDELFAETKRRFSELYTPVREKVGQVHPGLKKLGETNTGKIMEQIAFLEKRAKEALESRNEASLRQFQRIGMAVKPLGRPQERVYNPLAYLNKYGTDWLEELINTGGIDGKWHQIVLF